MKPLVTLTLAAALASTTAMAQEFSPAENAAIQTLASEGYREIRVQRGPFGTRLKAEAEGVERVIFIQFGEVVRDRTERDDDDDDDFDEYDDDDDYDDDDYDDDYEDDDYEDDDDDYDDDDNDDDDSDDDDDDDD